MQNKSRNIFTGRSLKAIIIYTMMVYRLSERCSKMVQRPTPMQPHILDNRI